MHFKAKISVVGIFLVLILAFQNCGSNDSRVSFTDDASKLGNSVDSGTPYEGKVYAILGSLCTDGSEIQSRIVMSSANKAQLNRENCQDMVPVSLTSSDFQMNPNSDSLTYKNQTYIYIGFAPLGITNFSISNDTDNFYYSYSYEGQPTFLQVYLDTDNNPATGYSKYGIGADYLIENDFVWKYSATAGDPQGTWAWTSLVSANTNNVSPNVSWSFARTAIGSPTLIKVVARTSLSIQTDVITQIPK